MAPQETIILTDFLLAPAALHHFLTPEQFADILPQSARGGPTVKELYRELQRLRREELDAVRDNIVDEVKASRRLKREYKERRQRDDRAAVAGLDTVALEIEEELSGHSQRKKPHPVHSIGAAIAEASKSIEAQIEDMEAEIRDSLSEMQEAVGELSDLRHGSFKSVGNGSVGEEVLATLKRLEAACVDPPG